MGAAAAVLDLLPAGARVMASTDCYAGVHALLADGQQQGRWHVGLVDITDTAAAAAAARRADLVWLESPTNPLLDIADLPVLCTAARDGGALVAVDNTFATPLLQQPIALGAHIAVHSATNSSAATLTCSSASPSPTPLSSPGGCAAAGRSPARPRRAGNLPRTARPAYPGPAAGPRPAQRRRPGAPPRRTPRRHPGTLPRPGRSSRPRTGSRADDRIRRRARVRSPDRRSS